MARHPACAMQNSRQQADLLTSSQPIRTQPGCNNQTNHKNPRQVTIRQGQLWDLGDPHALPTTPPTQATLSQAGGLCPSGGL